MKFTPEKIKELLDKFASAFVESAEAIGASATIVNKTDEQEFDCRLPCAICGKPNDIGDICEDCARIHAPVDDDGNIGLAAGHGYGY